MIVLLKKENQYSNVKEQRQGHLALPLFFHISVSNPQLPD
jgi:hypothetical protein